MRKLETQVAKLKSELEHARRLQSADEFATDPVLFAEKALRLELDPWQAQVIGADSRRDILNCSRQAGKSTSAAVLALHEALYKPNSVTVLVSPSQRQSSELFRKVIDLREALPWNVDLLENNKLSMEVRGGGRVLSLPGSEATIRGISSVTLLVEDEAARVLDDLHLAVKPMLAVNNGRLILMSTPFGKRGHYWQIWDEAPTRTEHSDGWHKVRIPAPDVPRISEEFLEEERRSMPEWWFLQEYMCEFMQADDQIFDYDLVQSAMSDDFEVFL